MKLALAIVAGFTLNLAFPDANVWPLAMVAVGALWWILDDTSAWGGFFYGWLFGIAFLLPHVWWAYVSVGALPWVALSVVEGIAFGLFGAAWAHVRRSGMLDEGRAWLSAPTFAVVWVAIEQLRSMVPFGGFPWGRLAFSMLDSPVSRLAWAGGAPLVSAVVACAAVLAAMGVRAVVDRRPLQAVLAPTVALVLIFGGLGVPLNAQAESGTLNVGAVQGNVPDRGLDAFAQAREVTNNHFDGSVALIDSEPGPMDVLLWPENAADYDPRRDQTTADIVTEAARLAGAPVLFGSNDYTPEDGRYNAAVLWSEQGVILEQYNKQRPAPFAEYVPFRDIARQFSDAVDRVSTDVLAGEGVGLIRLPVDRLDRTVGVGVVICFEVAYDEIVTDSVRAGAEVLFVPTNNASFGRTAESTQQLAMSRLRAIETGRSTIQISTVGVSGVIDPTGRVSQRTELFTPDQIYATVPLRDSLTPAVRFAPVIMWGFLLLPGLLVGSAMARRLRERYEW